MQPKRQNSQLRCQVTSLLLTNGNPTRNWEAQGKASLKRMPPKLEAIVKTEMYGADLDGYLNHPRKGDDNDEMIKKHPPSRGI
jgi:hypothetical protein